MIKKFRNLYLYRKKMFISLKDKTLIDRIDIYREIVRRTRFKKSRTFFRINNKKIKINKTEL